MHHIVARVSSFVSRSASGLAPRLATFAIAFALCGLLPQPSHAEAPAASVAAIPNRGTLYRVAHEGHVAYLFGTVHVGQASFYPLEPLVQRAFAASTQLAVELDIREQVPLKAALEKYGMLKPPQTIDQALSPGAWIRLQQALKRLGVQPQAIAKLKPWTISNVLLALTLEQAGFARDQGVEAVLLAQAKALDKPVVSLESADYQLGLFDQLDAAQQEQFLDETMESVQSGKLTSDAHALIDAWGSADSAALEKLLQEELSAPGVTADFTRRVLLEQRNPLLTGTIQKLIDANPNTFVAIGLLHLIGPDGIPKLLERRGFQVEKLY